ncbi:MAG: PAS domain S-box protein [Aphanocapsa sp. GSE-SYN-MK-11-07L]|jgi:PAS domain S-box-containing protein|nr:PAS domain S-box protein [Aphanocapsa sp. GSE-SYN-MK-11-07L]
MTSEPVQPKADILVVDDQPNNLKVLAALLAEQGYKVRKATSGEMALQAIRISAPDLVLLDIMMPEMDGYEVCIQLKASPDWREIPVIFLSALDEALDKVKAFQVGGSDYISKPYQIEEVLARIEHQLTIQQQRQQLIAQNVQLQQQVLYRQQTEAMLQESQHKLSRLVNSLPGIVFACANDADWSMRYLSEGCQTLTGYSSEELSGQSELNYNQIIDPSDWSSLRATIGAAIAQQQPYIAEYRIRTRSGAEKWLWEKGHGLWDQAGQLLGLEGFITDITELKTAEASLRESQGRFRSLVNNIPGVVYRCSHDLDWTLEYINDYISVITGYPAADLIGNHRRSFASLLHPEDYLAAEQTASEFGPTGQPYDQEYRLIHADGSIRWIRDRSYATLNAQGECVYFDGILLDVTELKQSATALVQSEARYRAISQLTTDHVYACDISASGEIIEAWSTSNLGQILGNEDQTEEDQTEIEPGRLGDIYLEDAPQVNQFIEELLTSKQPNSLEYRIMTTQGEVRWIRDRIQPEWDETEGRVVRILGAVEDITERKLVELELQASEQRFRSLIETSSDWVWEIDQNYTFTYSSPTSFDILGYMPTEVIGKPYLAFITGQEAERIGQIFASLIANRQPYRCLEGTYQHKDGYPIVLESNGSPIFSRGGALLGYRGITRDITERTEVAAVLQQEEEKYYSVFENAIDGIFQTTQDGSYISVNPALARILGYDSPADLISTLTNLNQGLYVNPQQRRQFVTQIAAQGFVEEFEAEVYRRDGSKIWTAETAWLVTDPNGNPLYYEGTSRDISDRKATEIALLKRERYLAALVEIQRQLLSFDGAGYPESLYEQVLEPLGQAAIASRTYVFENSQDASGKLLLSQRAEWCAEGITPEIDNPALQNLSYETWFPRWADILAQGGIVSGAVSEFPLSEQQILRPQGIFSVLILPIFVDGEFFGFIGFDHCLEARQWEPSEVTLLGAAAAAISLALEQKQAELALRKSEDRLRLVVSNAPIILFATDRQGQFTLSQGSSLGTLGLAPDQAVGQSAFELYQHEPDVIYSIQQALQGETFTTTNQVNGRFFETWFTPLLGENAEIEGTIGVAIDITERKQAESQIQASLKEKTVLLQEVHHRVKNNLQVISSLLRLQAQRVNDPLIQTILEDSQNRVMSMALVHQILYQTEDFGQVALADYVKILSAHLFNSLSVVSDRVQLQINIATEATVPLDKAIPCGLILNELISNALKHGLRQGSLDGNIWITLVKEATTRLTLTVANDGLPLAAEFDAETTQSMGLKLVNVLVGQLQADFQVERGETTTFSITFDPTAN